MSFAVPAAFAANQVRAGWLQMVARSFMLSVQQIENKKLEW
jgi:hypothetical protein